MTIVRSDLLSVEITKYKVRQSKKKIVKVVGNKMF